MIDFIKQDGRRFAWEIGLAILIASVTFGITALVYQNRLASSQADRLKLQKQAQADTEFRLSIEYGAKLKQKDLLLQDKEYELDSLRQKMALDSADRMSLIDAMRAINARYKGRN